MVICIILLLFFLYRHYELYSLKSTARDTFRNMLLMHKQNPDIGFETFYVANSCYYWAKYIDIVGVGKKLFWQSLYGVISLVMAVSFAFTNGILNPVTILGAITAGLIFLTGICREFSVNVTREQALINLKHNFCRDMKCASVDIALIMKWDDMAEQLTLSWLSGLTYHLNNLK